MDVQSNTAIVLELMTVCRKCEKPVRVSDMPMIKGHATSSGEIKRYRSGTCKECKSERSKPEQQRYYRKTKADLLATNPAAYMLKLVRHRALEREIPFDLVPEDIFIPEYCPILGIRLTSPGDGLTDASPTIDRLIAEKGYVKGNISVISSRANRIKSDASLAELERLCAWFCSQLGR